TIDSVISSFVMHFTIYENQLVEIYRVLKPGGYFVYNDYIYQKYPDHTKKIIQSIEKIGFSIEEKIISLIEPKSNSLKKHKIVIARKL
ncbi:methyltransferase domain-containing protein, partial [Proteus mirabilis]